MSARAAVGLLAVAQVVCPAIARAGDERPAELRLTIGHDTTRITGPVGPDGFPDYAAALNARLRVPPDQNAGLLLASVFGADLEPPALRAMGFDRASAPKPVPIIGLIGGGKEHLEPLERHLRERLAQPGGVPGLKELPPDLPGQLWGEWLQAKERAWRAEEFPLLAEWVRANEAALACVAEAVQRPRLWLPLPEGRPVYEAPVPHLLKARNAANLLRARALLRLGQGDWAGAAADLRTIDRLAVLLAQGPTLIDNLIGIAIRGLGSEALPVLAAGRGATAEALSRLHDELRAAPALGHPFEAVDRGERFIQLAQLVELMRSARKGRLSWKELDEEAEKAFGPVPPAAIDWNETARYINRNWDDAVLGMKAATGAERRAAGTRAVQRINDASAIFRAMTPERRGELVRNAPHDAGARAELGRSLGAMVFAVAMMPSLLRSAFSWNDAEALRDLTLLSLAVAAHRAREGRWPTSLAEVAPAQWKGASERNGYRFDVHAPPPSSDAGVALTATPDDFENTGGRGLCADASGRPVVAYEGAAPRAENGRCVEPAPQP